MSSECHRPQARIGLPLTALVLAALLGAAAVAGAPATPRTPVWVPSAVPAVDLRSTSDLFYDGMAGRLIGVDASGVAGLVATRGAAPIALREGETLYVYLVEDAMRADFEPPSRVLVRAGHEAVVATTGGTPVLTAAANASLRGLRQPVRISLAPIPWPEMSGGGEVGGPVSPPREVNPLIQSMISEMTTDSYVATWQHLDDFETRYAYTNQNVLASQWMLDQFHAMGLTAEFHYYTDQGQKRNVVATLPGVVDPTRVVYICGHFDSTSENPSVCAPGADDNATGTCAAIEAARVMSRYQFNYTIKFACFNGEEQGMYGSDAYVNEIAQAGENVIACFDCDMLAYRGIDPAPPDLVMYTNTASQPLAATLTDMINTYEPGQLQPITLVSSLEGSDYASFWHHNYKAICAIEDEAWGDDFCPWYHTCQDRIEQYPRDYVMSCSRAVLAAVATTAIPINPTGPYLVMTGTQLSDDNIGGSQGNGDGALNPGETIELWATVRNAGGAPAHHVTGTLVSQSADATVLTSTAAWNDIPAGGQSANLTPFRFQVAGNAPDAEALSFTLTLHDDTGNRDAPISLSVTAPSLRYDFSQIIDAITGNGNGIPDPGETIQITVRLANSGRQNAENVHAVLTSANPYVTIIDGTAGCPLIQSGGGKAQLAPPYRLLVAGNAPAGEIINLNLAITAGFGYTAASTFKIKVGSAFWDDLEAAGAWTIGAPDDDATTGIWVQVDPNGTTYGSPPQQCQAEDDHTPDPGHVCFVTGQGSVGGTAGEQDIDGGKTTLTSPVFDLTHVREPVVKYWRWYTNNLGNNPSEDTWLVQISSDGGTSWVDLERTTASANSWNQFTYSVASFVTPTAQVVVRFVASDYGANSLVEAAVDDFDIAGTPMTVAVGDDVRPLVLRLEPARPSPTSGMTTVAFALPASGHASLRLYGVDGRLVRTLANGEMAAGIHRVDMDGTGIAPGIYFYRLNAGGRELTRRLVIVK